jgi:hypothetical protein
MEDSSDLAMPSYSHTQKQSLGLYFVPVLGLLIMVFIVSALIAKHPDSASAFLSKIGFSHC